MAFTVCCSRLVPLRCLTVIQHPLCHNALPLKSQVPLFIVIQSFPRAVRCSMHRLRYNIVNRKPNDRLIDRLTDRSNKRPTTTKEDHPTVRTTQFIVEYRMEKLRVHVLTLINAARDRSWIRQ